MNPAQVKMEFCTWDKDCCCVLCGEKTNLHFDNEIPYSKAGTSLCANNARILYAKCNLSKSDEIMVIEPWFALDMLIASNNKARVKR
jgi:5-methylcytosine-specific restriction endonuclease McrA